MQASVHISTHSLIKRLTTTFFASSHAFFISTHSLIKRLTRENFTVNTKTGDFNSQPHKEADFRQVYKLLFLQYFNSQPHKEADLMGEKSMWLMGNFNSQPHKEADGGMHWLQYNSWKFQLTAS